jgi:hypothetical protein
MKVHLVRSNELPIFKFNNICEYLNEFKGEIKFEWVKEDEPENEMEEYESDPFLIKYTLEDHTPEDPNDFERFFEKCNKYREENNITNTDLVILLTNEKNVNNFFGYVTNDMRNVFIQTSNWRDIFGKELEDYFPIVYEIGAWTLRHLLFDSEGEMRSHILPRTYGCVMDMCVKKEDIRFKIRTGDIRSEVIDLIRIKKINPAYMNQLISIFEKVRKGVLFRERALITNQLTRLKLVEVGKKLKFKLVDFGDVVLELQPLENIIYTIFLSNNGGIRLNQMKSHPQLFDRVFNLYYLNKPDDYVTTQIEKYSAEENKELISQNIKRINDKIQLAIPEGICERYMILKGKGDKYGIALDRELVDLGVL